MQDLAWWLLGWLGGAVVLAWWLCAGLFVGLSAQDDCADCCVMDNEEH